MVGGGGSSALVSEAMLFLSAMGTIQATMLSGQVMITPRRTWRFPLDSSLSTCNQSSCRLLVRQSIIKKVLLNESR